MDCAIPELSNLTVVVLVFSLIFAGLIWLADSVLSRIVKLYFDFINQNMAEAVDLKKWYVVRAVSGQNKNS